MKLLKLKPILILFSVLLFSSCSDEEFTSRGTLNFSTNPVTDRGGYFESEFILYATDISGFNPSREDLLSVNTIDSWLEIYSNEFIQGDVIYKFYIDAEGVGTYYHERPLNIRHYNDVFTIDDDAYYDFMARVIDQLNRRGSTWITIYGYTNMNKCPVTFHLFNSLELRLRR